VVAATLIGAAVATAAGVATITMATTAGSRVTRNRRRRSALIVAAVVSAARWADTIARTPIAIFVAAGLVVVAPITDTHADTDVTTVIAAAFDGAGAQPCGEQRRGTDTEHHPTARRRAHGDSAGCVPGVGVAPGTCGVPGAIAPGASD
jgi:hypothetical protein